MPLLSIGESNERKSLNKIYAILNFPLAFYERAVTAKENSKLYDICVEIDLERDAYTVKIEFRLQIVGSDEQNRHLDRFLLDSSNC